MGLFECRVRRRHRAIAQAMAENDAVTVVGGGDSAAAIAQMGFAHRVACLHRRRRGLEFIEGQKLPGVVALET